MFKLTYITPTQRVTRYVAAGGLDAAIDAAIKDGARFITHKPVRDSK